MKPLWLGLLGWQHPGKQRDNEASFRLRGGAGTGPAGVQKLPEYTQRGESTPRCAKTDVGAFTFIVLGKKTKSNHGTDT